MDRLPLRGRPDDILGRLTALVGELVDVPPVVAFHFGRTANLAQARQRHPGEHFFALYATETGHDAVLVEQLLERTFGTHPRFTDNIVFDASPPTGCDPSFVYVAIWTSAPDNGDPSPGAAGEATRTASVAGRNLQEKGTLHPGPP